MTLTSERRVTRTRKLAGLVASYRWTLAWLTGCLTVELIEVLHR